MTNVNAEMAQAVQSIITQGKVLTDADSLDHYGGDWTKQYARNPALVVLPKNEAELQDLVKWANNSNVALVPSGGRTGLSGGAAATNGEVVVALDLMNEILEYDEVDRTVRCQAGVITAALQAFAEEQGCFYPVDFASSGSSQIGGNVATNAGGIKVIRYGLTRDWVVGLKVVTGTGECLDLNQGLVKNATGYDLRHLFIGSEGTLGFITEVTVKLAPAPVDSSVMVLALADLASVMPVLMAFRDRVSISAFEFFSERALQIVTEHQSLARPCETVALMYALIEYDNVDQASEEAAMEGFEHVVESGWVLDGVLSQSSVQAASLWRLREGISESLAQFSPYKNDLSVRVSQVPAFLAEVDGVVTAQYPDLETVWFGHIGDGNLHLNILKPADWTMDQFVERCTAVSPAIFEVVQRFGGSISAEHGVGLLKQPYLHYSRSAAEITLMQSLKKVFDPNSIMNPGKVL